MTLSEAQSWLADRYVLSPQYCPAAHPHHSVYAYVDVRATCVRVRERIKQERSFSGAVEQVRQKLRLVHGRVG